MRGDLVSTTSHAALPDVFLAYQQRLWAAVDRHGVVVVEKSRRTGYSWALAAIAAAHAATTRTAGGSDALYMGYEREMTREFIDYVATWAKAFQAAAGEVEEFVFRDPERPDADVGAFRIRFASGAEVVALPSVARALRGKQGLVILDEAAFMDDLAGILKSAFALRIWGGHIVVCSTHNGETNPFNELVQDIRAGRRPYHIERCTFADALEQGLYRRVCMRTGAAWTAEGEAAWAAGILAEYGDNADEELHVIPNPVSGTWLPGVLLEARAVDGVPVLRWECPPGFALLDERVRVAATTAWCRDVLAPVLARLDPERGHALGGDFGRVRDLSVDWLVEIGRDLVRRTRLVVELRNVPFEAQRQILFFLLDGTPRLRAVKLDAGGNGAYLAEVTQQRYGEDRVEAVLFSEGWYRDNMPPLKAALEDGTFTLPRDDDVLGDFRTIKLVRGVARVPDQRRNDGTAPRHGDAAIAGALAYAASRADPEEYGYQSARRVPVLEGAASRGGRAPDDEDDRRRPVRGLRGSI